MPELPDVELFRREINSRIRGRRIERVSVDEPRVLTDASPQAFGRRMKGRPLGSTKRVGKNLFVNLGDDEHWLRMHFGMTGSLQRLDADDDAPRYAAVTVHLEGGDRLAYVTQRKLGKVGLIGDLNDWLRDHEIGPDALGLSKRAFRGRLADARGMIKTRLMDQSILAGLGNVYTDEMLFQAKIHPRTRVDDLDDAAVGRLYDAMQRVLRKAISARADPARMPATWLLPHRDEDSPCPRCGGPIERANVGGRSARFCSACQRRRR